MLLLSLVGVVLSTDTTVVDEPGNTVIPDDIGTLESVDNAGAESPEHQQQSHALTLCDGLIKTNIDQMTGTSSQSMEEPLTLSGEGHSESAIVMDIHKQEDRLVWSMVLEGDAESCMDKNPKISLMFRNGPRLDIHGNNPANCDGRAEVHFSEPSTEPQLRTQLIENELITIHLWSLAGYEEQSFGDEQARRFQHTVACLQ